MRQLVQVTCTAKYKPRTMPEDDEYNPGKTMVSIKIKIDGKEKEQWLNVDAKTHAQWLRTVKRDKPLWLVEEWSSQKKNEQGKKGALVYRPILLPESMVRPANSSAKSTRNGKQPDPRIYKLSRFLKWLTAFPEGEERTPLQILLNRLVANKLLTKAQASNVHVEALDGCAFVIEKYPPPAKRKQREHQAA